MTHQLIRLHHTADKAQSESLVCIDPAK